MFVGPPEHRAQGQAATGAGPGAGPFLAGPAHEEHGRLPGAGTRCLGIAAAPDVGIAHELLGEVIGAEHLGREPHRQLLEDRLGRADRRAPRASTTGQSWRPSRRQPLPLSA